MVKLIETEKFVAPLRKKSFGERHVIMQKRAADRQKMKMEMVKKLRK